MYGNCSVTNENSPKNLITLADLKALRDKDSLDYTAQVESIKRKLDEVIIKEDWDIDDILEDHDYSKPETIDCVVYYATGLIFLNNEHFYHA